MCVCVCGGLWGVGGWGGGQGVCMVGVHCQAPNLGKLIHRFLDY